MEILENRELNDCTLLHCVIFMMAEWLNGAALVNVTESVAKNIFTDIICIQIVFA